MGYDRFNFAADLGSLPAEQRDARTTYRWVYVGAGTHPDAPPPQLAAPESSTPIAADVLAVQEVENIDALRLFNRDMLADPYPYEVRSRATTRGSSMSVCCHACRWPTSPATGSRSTPPIPSPCSDGICSSSTSSTHDVVAGR